MSVNNDVKLINMPPELCAKICDKLDGESAYELFKSCKQMHSALLSHAMLSSTTITVKIKLNDQWSPVPISRPGNVVYSFQQFGNDPVEEHILLNRQVMSILEGLENPNRQHSISFDFGVEITLPLRLFDGCRFLKLTGGSYDVPEFTDVHGLILNNRIKSYENINVPVLAINNGNDILFNSDIWQIDDALARTAELPNLQHVSVMTRPLFTGLITKLPNIKPGFRLCTAENWFNDSIPASIYGARELIANGTMISRFQHLESASINRCKTEHLAELNLRSFPPIIVPSADIRLPDVQYSILTRLTLDGEVGDLGALNGSAITYLDIRKCPNITRVYPDNRLDSFLCKSTFTDFENLTSLRLFNIDYKVDQQYGTTSHQKFLDTIGQMPNLQTLEFHNIVLDKITLNVQKLVCTYIRSPVITTSATSIDICTVKTRKLIATSECKIKINSALFDHISLPHKKSAIPHAPMIDICAPKATSFVSTIWKSPFRFTDLNMIRRLRVCTAIDIKMIVQLPNLEDLECDTIFDVGSRICTIDSRFAKLTHLRVIAQEQIIEIKKPIDTLYITGAFVNTPVVAVINAPCRELYTVHTYCMLNADVSTYLFFDFPSNLINPSVKIGTLVIDMGEYVHELQDLTDIKDMLEYLVKSVNCDVIKFRNTCVDGRFEAVKRSTQLLYFESSAFYIESGDWLGCEKVIVNDCTFQFSILGLPFYNAQSGLRLDSQV